MLKYPHLVLQYVCHYSTIVVLILFRPEVQLLPKTPSSKKTRARVNKNDSKRPKKRAK